MILASLKPNGEVSPSSRQASPPPGSKPKALIPDTWAAGVGPPTQVNTQQHSPSTQFIAQSPTTKGPYQCTNNTAAIF